MVDRRQLTTEYAPFFLLRVCVFLETGLPALQQRF